MFGNLRFITIFNNFLLSNQLDLSAHCSYHFSTTTVLRQHHIDFPMEISVIKFQALQLDEKPAFQN